MKHFLSLAALLAATILLSCSVQKRNYRPGFHVEWKDHSSKSTANVHALHKARKQSDPKLAATVIDPVNKKKSSDLIASVHSLPVKRLFTGTKTFIDNCDSIFLRKGEVVLAKVLEINPTEIKYKNCNNPDGPLIIIYKNAVSYIRYANGQVEEFPYEIPKAQTTTQRIDEIRVKEDSLSSLVNSIIGIPLLFAGGLGLIFFWFGIRNGKRALRRMGTDPRLNALYRKRAMAGFLTGLICYLLVALLICALMLYGLLVERAPGQGMAGQRRDGGSSACPASLANHPPGPPANGPSRSAHADDRSPHEFEPPNPEAGLGTALCGTAQPVGL